MSRTKKVVSGTLVVLFFCGIVTTAFFAADYLQGHPGLQQTIASFGYPAIFIVAIIAGLNVIVPVPAASLVPIFTTAGLYLPFIVLSLTFGTLVADYIGYRFGRWGSHHATKTYPKIIAWLNGVYTQHHSLILPATFIYAAFIPFPNEALVIPLAILGIPFLRLLIPLFLGNLVNQTIYALGVQTIFGWLF